VSIETCHPDATGKFNAATEQSLAWLTAYLLNKFKLTVGDIIRHYDVTGKICPKYYVDNPAAYENFKKMVQTELNKYGVVSQITQTNTAVSYKVKSTCDTLNIREGAGTNYPVRGKIEDKLEYTIVEEAKGDGSVKGWGKLKSGAGWVSLDYCQKV
jgi:N-acetylmuramoyl-L-alanine amidase CwlA